MKVKYVKKDYLHVIPLLKRRSKNTPNKLDFICTEISATVGVPLAIVYCYMHDITNNEHMKIKTEEMLEFYGAEII